MLEHEDDNMVNLSEQASPPKRPNVLAGSSGRQFSFGGRTQAPPPRLPSNLSTQARESNGDSTVQIGNEWDDTSKSPFTYALHVVFTSFVRLAEKKIGTILGSASDPEPDITALLGAGVDPIFDKVLKSLGYIARQNPKPVIDSVMFWRKSRSELKSDSNPSLTAANTGTVSGSLDQPLLHRRTTDPVRPSFTRSPSTTQGQQLTDPAREAAIQLDRKSLVSIYILCRTLVEIVQQLNADSLGDDIGGKLEEIVFNQLRMADPETLYLSPLRIANWNLFAELLGCLSAIRFNSVSDRFIADLEKCGRGIIPKEREARVEMIIHGMRHLDIKIYPVARLEESAEFLSSIAHFFLDAHGFRVKQAYAEVLHHLFLPAADTATAEVNFPPWLETVKSLYPKASKMLEKTRYFTSAFPLISTLLCVAPKDMFLDKWYLILEQNVSKIKDKSFRLIFVQNMARLVWTAVFRCSEPHVQFTRKMDSIFRMFFPAGRRLQHLLDLPQEPLVQMMRYVGFKHQDYCFRGMILPLIGVEHLNNADSALDLEVLHPERVTIAIRAFLLILDDLGSAADRPSFPIEFGHLSPSLDNGNHDIRLNVLNTLGIQNFHEKFSAYLCRVAFFCDQHFSGPAVLDERFSQNVKQSTTPVDASLNIMGLVRDKQQYYDLLASIFDALPRCLSSTTPIPKIIEIVCKGTAHVDPTVRLAAKRALKAMATTNKVQSTVVGYARVMLKFDALSPQTTEWKLKLYIELLNIWIARIGTKSRETDSTTPSNQASSSVAEHARGEEMEMINIWTVIEETEAHGLFFLCNQSKIIRASAIEILRLVSRFDAVMDGTRELSKSSNHLRQASKSSAKSVPISRIIDILTKEGPAMLDHIGEQASVAERSRTSKLKQDRSEETLIKIAQSDSGVDAAIWFKVFPRLIEICFKKFPITVVLCRNIVCNRLLKMQPMITAAIENLRSPNPFDVIARANARIATSPESMIEQWKLYLIMACATLTLTDEQLPKPNNHTRKRSIPTPNFERITSARSLFQIVLPMLAVDHTTIREAIVIALGCININLYKVLLEDMQPMMKALSESNRQKMSVKSGNVRNSKKLDRLRAEITHILQLTSHFMADKDILDDEWVLTTVLNFLKDVKSFLADDDVQIEWEYQRLRRYFCGLLEAVWEGLLIGSNAARWLPFDGRVSCFRLIEEWCNHGPHEHIARSREELMRQSIMTTYRDNRDRGALTASMEIEKRNVEFAALSAMASLCKGPVTQTLESLRNKKATISFEIDGVFSWIAAVFGSSSEKVHSVGRRALTNLLKYNLDFTILYQEAVHQCYTHDFDSKSAQSYFTVLAEVLTEQKSNPCGLSQLLALCLFKAGDKNVEIRAKTMALLRATEIRFYGKTCVDNFLATIENQNPVIYKRGQYLLAAQIAKNHEEQKFLIFSECSKFFRLVETRLQHDVVAILLPWLQIIELQLDVNGEDLDAASNMVLLNLFEITLRFNDTLHQEIDLLWTALVSGPHAGNVKAILDFTISQSVARREPLFVSCGKQVLVYLSRSPAGSKLVEALLAYLHPRSMVPQLKDPLRINPDDEPFTYIADLDRIFQGQQKHIVFSLGQLSFIFLVDLMVTPSPEVIPHTPTLLLVIFIMWDHYIPLVQNQARELFSYLTYNVCIDRNEDEPRKHSIHEYLQDFRRRDTRLTWDHEDTTLNHQSGKKMHSSMETMVQEVLQIYSSHYPSLLEEWGRTALQWGTACPVRHMACRSFQVFRCLSTGIDQNMLSDMLARLSNTIADTSLDIQAFAMEILCTINVIVQSLQANELLGFPQLFWTTIACLDTIHEAEFVEALSILNTLLDKLDIASPDSVRFLMSTLPPKWTGTYEGFSSALLKGLRSSVCMHETLQMVNRVMAIPSNEVTGPDSKLVFAVLANLPSFLHALENNELDSNIVVVADMLSNQASAQGLGALSRILSSFAKSKFRSSEDFTRQIASIIRQTYFPEWEAPVLVFLLGLLSNKQPWMKLCTMELLKAILPFVDTRRAEFAGVGADLISPLLRLLQTEYAQAGLEVLDKAISISGGPKDRQVLRMSLGNRTIRKEYEKTATLFGIPDESGWAVPMPAAAATRTRSNVHAVMYTCAVTMPSDEMPDHVQFHMEDYAYHAPSERSDTMLSVDGGESSLGDMVSALHNLDVFFTEDVDVSQASAPTASEQNTEQATATVYDSRVAAILSRSLARTPSSASFTSPGFDISPRQERTTLLDRQLDSPTANRFSFPRQPKNMSSSAKIPKSPTFSHGSASGAEEEDNRPLEIVLDDDKSEASFKLEGQLKKSATSMRSKLWSTRDPEKLREREREREKDKENKRKEKIQKLQNKASKSQEFLYPSSPTARGYFWSSTSKERP